MEHSQAAAPPARGPPNYQPPPPMGAPQPACGEAVAQAVVPSRWHTFPVPIPIPWQRMLGASGDRHGANQHTYLLPLLPGPPRWPLWSIVPWLPRDPSDAQSSAGSCLSLDRTKMMRIILGWLFQLTLALPSIISHHTADPVFLVPGTKSFEGIWTLPPPSNINPQA